MTISSASQDELLRIEQLYNEAFPKSERKPFELMIKKSEKGNMEILAIKESNMFLGLAITILYEDKVLLDYFAVSSDSRCSGVGSKALKMLFNRYNLKKFILEIELCDKNSLNNDERIRRKSFYLKNEMQETNINVSLFGVDMELLTHECEITFDEYLNIYKNTFGNKISKKIKLIK